MAESLNILFFVQPGTNSRSIFLDAARGVEKLGHRLVRFELQPFWQMYERDPARRQTAMEDVSSFVAAFIRDNRIDVSVSMWANALLSLTHAQRDGRAISFFDAIENPHLLIWLDAPHWAHSGVIRQHFNNPVFRSKHLFHQINNEPLAREMRQIFGMDNSFGEPYGVNEEIFRPYDEPKQYDIVFGCGPGDKRPTPVMAEEIARDVPDMQRIRHDQAERLLPQLRSMVETLDPALHAALHKVAGQLLQQQVHNRHQPMLERLDSIREQDGDLGPAIDALLGHPQLYVDLSMKIRRVERADRSFYFAFLARHFNCGLFGATDLKGWDCSVSSVGDVAYEEMARMYSRGRIGLNVSRWQDDVGINLKPLEISASGTACLSMYRTGIHDMFVEGEEILTYDTPAEARDEAHELLSNPSKLSAVAEAGRARTLRDHTWTVRMGRMLDRISGA